VAALIEREKADTLSPEEEAELDHFMELEHILRMAKARAGPPNPLSWRVMSAKNC